jgi:hypothetical protein
LQLIAKLPPKSWAIVLHEIVVHLFTSWAADFSVDGGQYRPGLAK